MIVRLQVEVRFSYSRFLGFSAILTFLVYLTPELPYVASCDLKDLTSTTHHTFKVKIYGGFHS